MEIDSDPSGLRFPVLQLRRFVVLERRTELAQGFEDDADEDSFLWWHVTISGEGSPVIY